MVLKYLFYFIFLVQLKAEVENNSTESYFLRVLDGLQFINTGRDEYNRTIYAKLTACMNRIDPTLEVFLNRGWEEVVNFWIERGDEWGKDLYYTAANGKLWERNLTSIPNLKGLVLQEPCNVASKLSVLQNIIDICKRMDEGPVFKFGDEKIRIYAKCMTQNYIAASFYHSARSFLTSNMADALTNRIYQVVFEDLVELLQTNSSIVKTFGEETRGNADFIVNIFQNVVIEEKYDKWFHEFRYYNVKRNIHNIFGITSIFACILEPENPNEIFDGVFDYLSHFLKLKEEIRTFFVENFIPEVQKTIPSMNLTNAQKKFIQERSSAVGAIFAYSIIFHGEEPMKQTFGIAKYPIVSSDEFFAKKLSRKKIPFASYVADMAVKNKFYSSDHEAYPGEKECSVKYGHPKYHTVARKAFLEAMYLVDDMRDILMKKESNFSNASPNDVKVLQDPLESISKSKEEANSPIESKATSLPTPKKDETSKRTIVLTLS